MARCWESVNRTPSAAVEGEVDGRTITCWKGEENSYDSTIQQ